MTKSSFSPSMCLMANLRLIMTVSFLILISAGCKDDEDNTPSPTTQIPTLSTVAVSGISEIAAVSGGTIVSDGGSAIVSKGVCWSTTPNPTITGNKTNDGSGSGAYVSNLSGLTPGTTYFVRAYATNGAGTGYGQQISFTTDASASLTNALESYWKLDEGTGSATEDAAGSWDLSFVSSPTWSSSGKINNCVDFGTVSQRYLERTGISSGDTNTYTLAAWINLENGSADAKMIMGMNSGVSVSNAGAAEVKIYLSTDNKLVASYHTLNGQSSPMVRIGTTDIPLNTWVHVAGVINNGNIELYVNGQPDNTNAVTNTDASKLIFSNGRVSVGTARLFNGSYNTLRWFRGKIDEAGIWTRPLSSGEIQMLYNSGNGLQYPF